MDAPFAPTHGRPPPIAAGTVLTPARSDPVDGERSPFWSIAVTLMLLSVMSYLDRQILALMVPDLHRDLGMTDLQVATLIGPAFIVTYVLALLFAATIVDRLDKATIIVCGTLCWAIMTFASAFAQSYGELIVLRAGLAIGEAMLGPAATALIGELFADDRRKRLTASAFFLMGSTIGASGSAAFGAFAIQIVSAIHVTLPRIGPASSWRLALIAVSLPSAVLAGVLLLLDRVARRRRAVPRSASTVSGVEGLRAHLRLRGRSYALLFVAVNVMLMAQVGTFIWGPTYLMRRFGLRQIDAGYTFGVVALLGGVCGTLASTAIIRRWAPDGTARQFARLTLAVGPPGLLLLAAAMLVPSLQLCMGMLGVALLAIGVLVVLPMQYLQSIAPAHLKGRIAVGMYVILYVFTSGLGPVVPPAIARYLAPGTDQLGRAIAVTAVASVIVALLLLVPLAYRRRRD